MFSNLGPLFKTQFRQTESSDARQYIPHKEKDITHKKEGQQQNEAKQEAWVDDASVSVEALQAFLIGFLKTLTGEQDSLSPLAPSAMSQRPKESSRPTNTHNAKAVRAYQTMAAHAATAPPVKSSGIEQPSKQEPSADLVQSEELRNIHWLIDMLDILSTHNVTVLHIQKAESFVASLKQAVKEQLVKLGLSSPE